MQITALIKRNTNRNQVEQEDNLKKYLDVIHAKKKYKNRTIYYLSKFDYLAKADVIF